MRFRLFGVPIEVHAGFFLITVFWGYPVLQRLGIGPFLLVAPVLFLSILVHEFGHVFAVRRFGMEPTVTLYAFGGLTSWRPGAVRVGRLGSIFIAFAGPAAGFLFAGILFGVQYLLRESWVELPPIVQYAYAQLLFINWAWGLFNLVPVMPLDGGHILEHALGPTRLRMATIVSMVAGVGIGGDFLITYDDKWIALILGMGVFQSYQRYRAAGGTVPGAGAVRARVVEPERERPTDADVELAAAERALAEEQYERAATLAALIASRASGDPSRRRAFVILGWAELLRGRLPQAARALAELERLGAVDAALAAALLRERGDDEQARRVLEAARAAGDHRKEVVGPLIQLLIAKGEVARAAAIAYDIVDTLSEGDTRHMAQVAFEAHAYEWASRLSEAVFTRTGTPEDAYEAARSRALEGDDSAALALLKRAVAAGFTDTTRAWSDAALEGLRAAGALDALLPRAGAKS